MRHHSDKAGNYVSVAIIIIVAIPLWLPLMIFTVDKYYYTPTRNIETLWDANIPSSFNQVYHKSPGSIYNLC